MNTPKELIKATYERWKQYVLGNMPLEDYLLITIAKLSSLAIGVAIGYYLL